MNQVVVDLGDSSSSAPPPASGGGLKLSSSSYVPPKVEGAGSAQMDAAWGDSSWADFDDGSAIPTLTVYDRDGVRLTFDFDPIADEGTVVIHATLASFRDLNGPLSDVKIAIAAPKLYVVEPKAPSSKTLFKGDTNAITQDFRVSRDSSAAA